MLKIFYIILTQLQISAGQQNKLCFSFVSKVFENLFFLLLKCFILVVFGFNFVFFIRTSKKLAIKVNFEGTVVESHNTWQLCFFCLLFFLSLSSSSINFTSKYFGTSKNKLKSKIFVTKKK